MIGWDEFVAFAGEEEGLLGQGGNELMAAPALVAKEGKRFKDGDDTGDQLGNRKESVFYN